jgi:type I restriction enzyme M protein
MEVIVTNPPFGGMEEDGIEMNFPQAFRTRETADLFLVLIMHLLKDVGRAAIVLPDGTLFGEGVKTRIKEKLLTECNVHTIVRLPNGVFNPYTGIKTNILFFEKGKPTRHIWYYEHPYPPGQKSYNKTNPIRIEEFEPEKKWWKKRFENEHAWKVDFKKLLDETKARAQPHWEAAEKYQKEALDKEGDEQERLETLARSERSAGDAVYATAFNLDRKNPNSSEDGPGDPEKLLAEFQKLEAEIGATRERLKQELITALGR